MRLKSMFLFLATLFFSIQVGITNPQILDPFDSLRAGFAHGEEDPNSQGFGDFSFVEGEQKGDSSDELEPAYDPYLDAVPLQTFDLKSIQQLRASLGMSYRDGNDPYAKEYAKKDPLTRFPALQYRDDQYWVIDNYRATRLTGERGELLEDGSKREKNEVEIRWTSALIDLDKLKNVYWVMTTFNTRVGPIKFKTGHAQLYFEFEDGGVQTPMGNFDSLVNSYEGFRDAGTIFNPLVGMLGKYESIFVMGSFEDITLKALMVFNGVDLYHLDIKGDELKTLLINSLAQATDREHLKTKKYHTTRNSCVTNQVRLMNSCLPEKRRIKEWHTFLGFRTIRTLGSILPSQIPKTLRKTKLMLSEEHYIGRTKIAELYKKGAKRIEMQHQQTQKFELLYAAQ
jgi:hypothetical protein